MGPTEPSSRAASHRLSSSSSRLDVYESLDKDAFTGTRDGPRSYRSDNRAEPAALGSSNTGAFARNEGALFLVGDGAPALTLIGGSKPF
jgi:hypothetical protein